MTPATLSPSKAFVTIAEPFPEHALPRLWKWAEDSRHQMADEFSPKTLDEFVTHWERLVHSGHRSWAVFADGELGGALTSRRLNPMLADIHAVFKRTLWGRGVAVEAFRLVLSELFNDGVLKISSACFADNHAVLGLVGKLGFEREARLRKHTFRDGKLVDMAVVGLTAERFKHVFGEPAGQLIETAKEDDICPGS